MQEKVDVCVIGAGAVGLFCALEVAKTGKTVRLVEKSYLGTSRHNIGEVLTQGRQKAELDFLKFTYQAWQTAADEFGEELGFAMRGALYYAFSEEDVKTLEEEIEADKGGGFTNIWLDCPEKVSAILGGVETPEGLLAAKFAPEDALIDSGKALDVLRKHIIRQGVRIWGDTQMSEFIIENNNVVGIKTADGDECQADATILCAGVWATKILKNIGVNLPMRPARSHIVQLSTVRQMPVQMLVKRYKGRGSLMVKQQVRTGRMLLAYTGLMDQAQATWSSDVDEEVIAWMTEEAESILPALKGASVMETRAISLAVTPDFRPFLGKAKELEQLYVSTGYLGKSFAAAAGAAKVMAALVDGKESPVDLTPFDPGRFLKE